LKAPKRNSKKEENGVSIFKKTVFVVKKAAAFLFESVAALVIFLRPRGGGPSATTIKGETINGMSKEEYEWFLWLEGMR
jgi:hypothetical protein